MRAIAKAVLSICWSLALGLAPAVGAVEVTALARGDEPLIETDLVRYFRLADFSEQPAVAVGLVLEPGDELISVSTEIDLELTCSDGSVLRFASGFRVLIELPEAASCAVNYLSGALGVLSGDPAASDPEISAGGIDIGVEGTEFLAELERVDDAPSHRVTVFDGAVVVRGPELEQRIEAGKVWRHYRREEMWTEVTNVEVHRAAALNARLDVAQTVARGGGAVRGDASAAVAALKERYVAVLERPDDEARRVELARAQLTYSAPERARRNLIRAGVTSEEELVANRIDPQVMSVEYRRPPSLERVVPVEPPEDAWALVVARRYDDAAALAKRRMEAGTATGRDICALASVYSRTGARLNAQEMARRGLEVARGDRSLDAEVERACKRLASGPGR